MNPGSEKQISAEHIKRRINARLERVAIVSSLSVVDSPPQPSNGAEPVPAQADPVGAPVDDGGRPPAQGASTAAVAPAERVDVPKQTTTQAAEQVGRDRRDQIKNSIERIPVLGTLARWVYKLIMLPTRFYRLERQMLREIKDLRQLNAGMQSQIVYSQEAFEGYITDLQNALEQNVGRLQNMLQQNVSQLQNTIQQNIALLQVQDNQLAEQNMRIQEHFHEHISQLYERDTDLQDGVVVLQDRVEEYVTSLQGQDARLEEEIHTHVNRLQDMNVEFQGVVQKNLTRFYVEVRENFMSLEGSLNETVTQAQNSLQQQIV
ncbi:hypothetical protein GF380_00185, partial [Candidatus Uhrbacteria bacterium]|nr:hypothetical protein [Candidatus Uhrbacteria bacterium]